jgi:F0F1-type ATP synthase assembly protein I
MEIKSPNEPPKRIKNLSDYARYSNLAFQMIAILLVGAFGGIKLDKWLHLTFPIFTVLLSFIAVVLAIYLGLKDFMHPKKQ